MGGEGSFNTTSVCRPILSTWIYHTREYDLEVPRGEANPQPFDVFLGGELCRPKSDELKR